MELGSPTQPKTLNSGRGSFRIVAACARRGVAQDSDHLAILCTRFHQQMAADTFYGLQRLVRSLPAEIVVGSACSGTDIVVAVMETLVSHWGQFGSTSTFRHAFSCDTKPASQMFIKSVFKPEAPDGFPAQALPTCEICLLGGMPRSSHIRGYAVKTLLKFRLAPSSS